MKVFLFTASLLLLLSSFSASADVDAVQATIDKNPVMVDEAIRLTVTAQGSADRDAFDSSSLLKDFVVGRTSVSSQTSIVNFDTTRTTTWTTTLFPRSEGKFTIPAFNIEGKKTSPISVEVIPVQSSSKVARDYFVTTDIDLKDAYLNQQLLYTVKLHLASSIERGSLQSPEMPNADIRQLGEDKQYTDIINGRRYQIIERRFAIVPQSSGEFTIRGPIFNGEVMASNNTQRFGFFNRTQQVSRVGPDITVTVKPIPSNIDYPWLPSEMVRVDEEWPQGETFTVGEPVTRVVTLTAIGVVEEQLPDIPEFYPPNFKLYPDQSTTTTVDKDNALIAQRTTSLALIPTKSGDMVLPEVTIPWFNTLTEQTEFATLPARTVTVAPANAADSATPAVANNKESEIATPSREEVRPPQTNSQPNSSATQASTPHFITWLFIGLWVITVVGWLATYIVLKRRAKHQIASAPSSTAIIPDNEKKAFNALKSALDKKDVSEITPALQNWLSVLYPQQKGILTPRSFSETQGIQAPYDELLRAKFSQVNGSWKAETLNSAIHNARKMWLNRQKQGEPTLSPLYPQK